MLFAAIDIGSNAVRLFFSNVFEQNGVVIAEKASLVRIPIRLGEDVFNNQIISQTKTDKLIQTMKAFKLLIDVYEPVDWKACATAAMREATNNAEVISKVKEETGVEIQIIDGLEEASIVSTMGNLEISKKYRYAMFVDVGGGSTEISITENGKIIASNSFFIGTVRLLNKQVRKKEWEKMAKWLDVFKSDFGKIFCIGSGGNINKLTKLYGRIPENILSYDNLEYALSHLDRFTVKERIELMGLRPDRADVIVPAGLIFKFILAHIKSDFIYVPKIGLSDGLVINLYNEHKKKS
jgi:exopolyphosphatase / guanosine-5'-triphosphate,3'-diphosphate pyrophosphatase